jgi:hypothetical protein
MNTTTDGRDVSSQNGAHTIQTCLAPRPRPWFDWYQKVYPGVESMKPSGGKLLKGIMPDKAKREQQERLKAAQVDLPLLLPLLFPMLLLFLLLLFQPSSVLSGVGSLNPNSRLPVVCEMGTCRTYRIPDGSCSQVRRNAGLAKSKVVHPTQASLTISLSNAFRQHLPLVRSTIRSSNKFAFR